jgi:hypothetical protein
MRPTRDWRQHHGLFLSPSSRAWPRPIPHPLHQVLLDSVRQDVREALDLSPLFLGDHGHVVAAFEDVSLPASQTVDLAGELGLDVAHEAGDLQGSSTTARRGKCDESVVTAQRVRSWFRWHRPRTPRTRSLSAGPGRKRKRSWTARQVMKTRVQGARIASISQAMPLMDTVIVSTDRSIC